MIDAPGFYDLDFAAYRADPCPTPSLNHSIAKQMLRSPLHAWRAHPRLGAIERDATRAMNTGSAVHDLVLGKGKGVVTLDFENFRTKAAQEARDAALAAGKTPMLVHEHAAAQILAAYAKAALEAELGKDYLAEQTAIAVDEHGSWMRIRTDAKTPDHRVILDLKVVASAEPDEFGRWVRKECATQGAFYDHTLGALDPAGVGKRRFVFMAQERGVPEAITFHELDPALMEIAQAKMARARAKWAACLAQNKWPAYDRGPHLIAPMPWEIEAEIDAEYEERVAAASEVVL